MLESRRSPRLCPAIRFSAESLMPPEIFGIIENTPPVNGEVGFTAAMNTLAKQGRLNAVDFIGNRFDMGNKLGILKANCEWACVTPSSRTISRRIYLLPHLMSMIWLHKQSLSQA